MSTLKDTLPTELIRSRTDPERYLEDFEEAHSSREFLSIKNLDTFFNNLYEYHKQGGFWSIIYSKISNLITIAFTITFSVFLVGFINWNHVINCGKSDDECKNVILIQNNIMKNKIFGTIVIIYTIVFILYFIWHLLNFIVSLSSLTITQSFYAEKLNINDELLRQLPWSSVINNIVSLQKKSIRLYHNKYLDALDITNRILRKENYIIAFINKGILDFSFPTNTGIFSANFDQYSLPKKPAKKFKIKPKKTSQKKRNFKLKFNTEEDTLLCKNEQNEQTDSLDGQHCGGYFGSVLEWNIRYIIFSSMFDDEMKIKDSFLVNSQSLKWKFFWFGIGNLLLTPFTLVFRIIFFFLQNAEEMHNNKTDLFSFREWSSIAKLYFREFNELSHEFDTRVLLAHECAVKYINSFPTAPHKRILSELISYISGSIVAVLLLLTFIDSSILLNIELFDRSLVWFLAIFSALLALSRSGHNSCNDTCRNFEVLMNEIAANTHYFPKQWQHKCHTQGVRDEFMNLYQPKLNLFLHEMLSVFTTPFILMFTLPNCVDKLLLFVRQYTDHIDGVGHICSYSRFDFKRFKHYSVRQSKVNNNTNNSNKIGFLSPLDNRQISDISNLSSASSNTIISQDNETDEKQQEINIKDLKLLHNKKLESSFLTFAMNNPKWRSNEYQSIVLQGIMENAVSTTTNTHTYTSTPESNKTNKQLGATFSELLQSSQSQYLIGYSNENIQQSTNSLFNTLQRHVDNSNDNGNDNENVNENNMMLSEINESDMSPSDSSIHNEEEVEEEEQEYHNAPYKTLLDHQQKM